MPAMAHPGIGRTARGQAVACNHYLPANRFDWFDVQPPATDAIRVREGADSAQDALRDEFCSPFSTIVGSHFEELPPMTLGRTIAWDNLPDDLPNQWSPNVVPGIEFAVRTVRPQSIPVLRTLRVPIGRGMQDRTILINAVEEGHEPDGIRSLFIDFVIPQRAVGLEFGFLGDAEREIAPNHVQLIARDIDGNVLAISVASDTHPQNINANSVFNVIGVRHQGGAIRSVELTFGTRDDPIPESQLIQRIWHEPLPPAAMKQGILAFERPGPDPVNPDHRLPPAPVPLGPAEIKLPFLCNRAMAIMRGFKFQFLDQRARQLRALDARIEAPPVFQVAPGGTVVLDPAGMLLSDSAPAVGFRILIYFTLLAWDDEQMELFTGEANDVASHLPQDATTTLRDIERDDPCLAATGMQTLGADPSDLCGPLFAVMRGFGFYMPVDQNLSQVRLATGQVGGGGGGQFDEAGAPFFVPTVDVSPPGLERNGSKIEWSTVSMLEGGPEYARIVHGTVMTGRSLRLRTEEFAFAFTGRRRVGRRENPDDWTTTFDDGPGRIGAWPIEADMACLGLGMFLMRPQGAISELEAEVHGLNYDGQLIQWQMGGGIVSDDDDVEDFFVWATFAGLVRKSVRGSVQLRIQGPEFIGTVGSVSLAPSQPGIITNLGNMQALIVDVRKGGPQAGEFDVRLEYHGQVFSISDLPLRGPLLLAPGEAVVIGGRFFSQAAAGPHFAFLEFDTNDPRTPLARVEISGRIVAADAVGLWLPSSINLGAVSIRTGVTQTRNAVLQSVGHTPLLITSLAVLDQNAGFEISPTAGPGAHYQLDPGDSIVIQVHYPRPARAGRVETALVAETNAGRLELPLRVEAVDN